MSSASSSSKPRGRPPRDDGPGGRQRLLAAARQQFSERGYSATTIDHLVTAAGVNPPTLYHHFGDKFGLFVAAADDAYEEVLNVFRTAVDVAGSFDDSVDSLFDVSVRMMRSDPSLAKLFLVIQFELPRDPDLSERLRPTLRRFREFFDGIAATAPRRLASDANERRQLSRALVALINGLNGEALMLTRPEDFSQVVDRMRALVNPR